MRRAREVVGDAPQVFLRGNCIGQLQGKIELVRAEADESQDATLSLSLHTPSDAEPRLAC